MASDLEELMEKAEKKLVEEGKIVHRDCFHIYAIPGEHPGYYERKQEIKDEAKKMKERATFEKLKKKHNW